MNTVQRTYDLLASRNMTLFEFTSKNDIAYNTVKTAEKRGTQLKVETIERICEGLGITLSDFFAEECQKVH